MFKHSALLLGSCLAALSVSSVAFAQDADAVVEGTFGVLGISVGVGVLNLPATPTGVYSSGTGSFNTTTQEAAIGPQLGVAYGTGIGSVGSLDVFAGASLTGVLAGSNTTAVDRFTGPGVVSILSFSPGTAAFDLDTTRDGVNGDANVTNLGVAGTPAPNQINNGNQNGPGHAGSQQLNTQPGGWIFGAQRIGDNGTSASAYAAAADGNGFSFLGVGDLEGLSISTEVTENAFYTDADIYIGLSGAADASQATNIQAYVGPTVRYLGRDLNSSIRVDIPEVAGQVPDFVTIGLDRYEELDASYLGGLFGLGVSHIDKSTGISYSLNGEGGIYAYYFDYSGSEKFIMGPNTVNSNTSLSEQDNGAAWYARAEAAVTVPVRQRTTLSFGGSVEYLSKVPGIDRSQSPLAVTSQIGNDHDADYNSVAGANTNSHISIADMWSFAATVSVTTVF